MRIRVRLAITGIAMLISLQSTPANAHQSDATGEIQAGSNGLVRLAVQGHWGFAQQSPWYAAWQVSRNSFTVEPENEGFGGMAEVGREWRRFSFGARYGALKTTAYELTTYGAGLSGRLRFLPWEGLSSVEKSELSGEDKKQLAQQRERQSREAVPAAPVLIVDLDWLTLNSPQALDGGIEGQLASAFFVFRLKPWVNVTPGFFAFGYTGQPVTSGANLTVFSNPSIRMVKIGPQGPLSGVFGVIESAQQLLLNFHISPHFGAQFAFTRVNVGAPDEDQLSYWFGVERRLGWENRWTVSSAFEFVQGPPSLTGYFTIRFRKELGPPFVAN